MSASTHSAPSSVAWQQHTLESFDRFRRLCHSIVEEGSSVPALCYLDASPEIQKHALARLFGKSPNEVTQPPVDVPFEALSDEKQMNLVGMAVNLVRCLAPGLGSPSAFFDRVVVELQKLSRGGCGGDDDDRDEKMEEDGGGVIEEEEKETQRKEEEGPVSGVVGVRRKEEGGEDSSLSWVESIRWCVEGVDGPREGNRRRRLLAKEEREEGRLRFDMLPPDVVVSEILAHLTIRIRVRKVYREPGIVAGVRIRADVMDFTGNSLESAFCSSKYEFEGHPCAKVLFGYFSRDLMRHPWFIYRTIYWDTRSAGIHFLVLSSKHVRSLVMKRPLPRPWWHSDAMCRIEEIGVLFPFPLKKEWSWRGSSLMLMIPEDRLGTFPRFSGTDRSHLKRLDVYGDVVNGLSECESLTSLESLRWICSELVYFKDFFARNSSTQLRSLYLRRCDRFTGLPPGGNYDHLSSLTLFDCPFSDITFQMYAFPSLTSLRLDFRIKCSGVRWQLNARQLQKLELRGALAAGVLDHLLQNADNLETLILKIQEASSVVGTSNWRIPRLTELRCATTGPLVFPIVVAPNNLERIHGDIHSIDQFLLPFKLDSLKELKFVTVPVEQPFGTMDLPRSDRLQTLLASSMSIRYFQHQPLVDLRTLVVGKLVSENCDISQRCPFFDRLLPHFLLDLRTSLCRLLSLIPLLLSSIQRSSHFPLDVLDSSRLRRLVLEDATDRIEVSHDGGDIQNFFYDWHQKPGVRKNEETLFQSMPQNQNSSVRELKLLVRIMSGLRHWMLGSMGFVHFFRKE